MTKTRIKEGSPYKKIKSDHENTIKTIYYGLRKCIKFKHYLQSKINHALFGTFVRAHKIDKLLIKIAFSVL